MRRLILMAVAIPAAVYVTVAFSAAAPATLEAAKHSATEAHAAITEDEARTTADRKRAASADAVVTAIEAESPPKEEPPPTGAEVNAAPTGPTGAWSVAYADGFGASLSTDTAWTAGNKNNGCCGNSNEIAIERPTQAAVGPEGLSLTCSYLETAVEGRHYDCADVTDKQISYELGRGATFAFEVVAKLPYCTGECDPAFWSISHTRWPPEIDFWEEWGWGSCFQPSASTNLAGNANCISGMPVDKTNGLGSAEAFEKLYAKSPPTDPSAGFHRYTTVISGPASSATFDTYIDGVKQLGIVHSVNTDGMNLKLTFAMRTPKCSEGTAPGLTSCYFKSGTRVFAIRSAAVYEDSGHAGQFISGGGIAPGTTVK